MNRPDHTRYPRAAQDAVCPHAKPARIDRLGDVFASGVLAAVSNPIERRTLFANAISSGSDTGQPNYRLHWHSDDSVAQLIGSTRPTVNERQNRLQDKGIISRIETRGGRTRLTQLAEYSALVDIAEAHGGKIFDIHPARRPTGVDWIHFPDEILKSGILKHLPNIAGELLILYAWLINPDPDAPDFGQYSISDTTAAAILYRNPRNIHEARKILISANLIARDGKAITLLAHTAAAIAKRRPAKSASPHTFKDKDKHGKTAEERCKQARTKPDQVTTGQQKTKPDQVTTGRGIRSRQVNGSGYDRLTDQVTTQTTNEPQQRTIKGNHIGESKNGEVNGSINYASRDYIRLTELNDIINGRPPVTPADHARIDEAKREKKRLTRGNQESPGPSTPQDAAGTAYADAGEAAAVRPQPDPRLQERLRQLLNDKSVQENNRIVHELQDRINALRTEQLTTAETQDRIDQLIADRIAVLEAEKEPPQDTTDTPSPPAAEPESQAPDETDREFRQDKINHSQRRCREHRRNQAIFTSLSKLISHRQNGTASRPASAP